MSVVLNGSDLSIDDLVAIAREHAPARLDPGAAARMAETRAIVERALARGDQVYGLNTGVGVLKRVGVQADAEALASFNLAMLRGHRMAQGPLAPDDVARATLVCLANTLARGSAGVRPEVVERLVERLNAGDPPAIHILGSIGQADLASMADVALGTVADLALQPGEALAVLDNNAFATGWGALALADTRRLLGAMEAAGSLSLEAFAANLTMLHPAIDAARPYLGLARARERLAARLQGSRLFEPASARNLQDPLTFRNQPQILGAALDVLAFAEAQATIELNASQGNPIVVADEERLISVANFEALPLALALDAVRGALATAVGSSSERAVKLLERPWSGLPTGLTDRSDRADAGLSMLGIAVQSFASEARLLAQPVSFELVSTSHAEGIEDRMTMAPLAARRLAEMVGLAELVVAVELVVAAQAVELRGPQGMAAGTRSTLASVRERFPFFDGHDLASADLQPVVELVRSGEL
ncbi:MAG: aromatic amino acid lyase [Actinomycetota bacterium]